jgi:HSP20 family protein
MRGYTDPFEQMEVMMEQMRRSAMGSWADQGRPVTGDLGRTRPGISRGSARSAGVTVEQRDEGFVVLADLPGFEREEIDLTFDDGFLTIEGTHEVTEGKEYRQRMVSESVRVPGSVAVEDANATYRNGGLEVTLPLEEESSDEFRIDVE